MAKRGNPNWKPGVSGNPNGRPSKPEIDDLRAALDKVKEEQNLSLLEHLVRRAYEDNSVLIALARKLLPDLKSTDLAVTAETISQTPQSLAEEKKLLEARFKRIQAVEKAEDCIQRN